MLAIFMCQNTTLDVYALFHSLHLMYLNYYVRCTIILIECYEETKVS